MEPILQGCVVLDCTGRLGWLAGRLLADLGAEVIKLEVPGADVSSSDWCALNVNKRLVRIDPADPGGRRTLDQLAASADILIATPRPGPDEARLFDYARLSAINERLIVVVISPFGLTGPKADWCASDIEIMAAGGAMSLAGEPDGAPLRVSSPQSYAWAGGQAAVGALMALAARWRTGRGQLVDVSAQAAVITALSHAATFVDILGITPTRAGAYMTGRSVTGANYRVFWPCRDGFINFILYGGPAGRRTSEQLVAWMRERGFDLAGLGEIDWARFDPTLANQAEVDAIEGPVGRFIGSLTKREFLEGAHQREMLGYPVSNTADIATDPQLEARGFWQDIPGLGDRIDRHCGSFVVVDGVRPSLVHRSDEPERASAKGM